MNGANARKERRTMQTTNEVAGYTSSPASFDFSLDGNNLSRTELKM
jgi:hypothetical protein